MPEQPTSEQQAAARKIIEHLELMRQRPGMCFGVELIGMVAFFSGFEQACRVFGMPIERDGDRIDLYHQIVEERGWRFSNWHFVYEMQERGMSYHEIADESFAVEIEMWKRCYGLDIA